MQRNRSPSGYKAYSDALQNVGNSFLDAVEAVEILEKGIVDKESVLKSLEETLHSVEKDAEETFHEIKCVVEECRSVVLETLTQTQKNSAMILEQEISRRKRLVADINCVVTKIGRKVDVENFLPEIQENQQYLHFLIECAHKCQEGDLNIIAAQDIFKKNDGNEIITVLRNLWGVEKISNKFSRIEKNEGLFCDAFTLEGILNLHVSDCKARQIIITNEQLVSLVFYEVEGEYRVSFSDSSILIHYKIERIPQVDYFLVDVLVKGCRINENPIKILMMTDIPPQFKCFALLSVDNKEENSFKNPIAIAASENNEIFITDNSHCVYVLHFMGDFIRKWGIKGSGKDGLKFPRGIDVNNEEVFVCDRGNHRIQVFNTQGTWLRSIGGRKYGFSGNHDGQLNRPFGVKVIGDSVYVVENGNCRISMFSRSGTFLKKWGRYGHSEGEFRYPTFIAANRHLHELYVTDQYNHRVQVFDFEGNFLRKWGQQGTEAGSFKYPKGICLSGQNVVVCDDENNRVQIFDKSGVLLRIIGSKGCQGGQFDGPYGVSVFRRILYVTEWNNNRIQLLR